MPGYEIFGQEERDAITALLATNGSVLSRHGFDGLRNGVFKVLEFERAFAARLSTPHALAVSSGSSALKVALRAMNIEPGDEVIIPAFTFVATAEAVLELGAKPVIVDVDDTLNMCPEDAARAINGRTRAIIVVHMMGAPAQMAPILALAARHSIAVLEDNAQCLGGTYAGRPLGTLGAMGTFSFDPGKTITTGEGGMVVTADPQLFQRARAYHDHGHEYSDTLPRGAEGALLTGFNHRVTEITGAIGLVQLGKLDFILERQRQNKSVLLRQLGAWPFPFRRSAEAGEEISDSLIFFCETEQQARRFAQGMRDAGHPSKNVPDAIRWHFAPHWTHMFEQYGFHNDHETRWQASARWVQRSVAVPISVMASEADLCRIAESLHKITRAVS